MFNNTSTVISREFILRRVSEEDIFKRYLGLEPTTVGSFTNPLRPNDNSPGCGFYVDSRGVWKFKDHAAGYNWDCFNVVEFDYGLSFKEAMVKIAIDFNLIDGDSTVKHFKTINKRARTPLEIRIKRRSWTKEDYTIWAKYYIKPERLEFFNVAPVFMAWFLEDGALRTIYGHKKDDPCFAYYFGGYDYKLYFPLRNRGKHLHVKSTILQGYNQLPSDGDNLLLTKSYKDVMSLDLFSSAFDLYSIAPMSETIVMHPDQFKDLYNRFDNIGTLFDLDRTGIKLTRKYEAAYDTRSFFFGKEHRKVVFGKPVIKDFSDYLATNGVDNTKRLIEHFLTNKEHGRDEEAF